jgi:hypothetical protein
MKIGIGAIGSRKGSIAVLIGKISRYAKHYLINCVNGKYRGLQPPVFFCLILNFTQ